MLPDDESPMSLHVLTAARQNTAQVPGCVGFDSALAQLSPEANPAETCTSVWTGSRLCPSAARRRNSAKQRANQARRMTNLTASKSHEHCDRHTSQTRIESSDSVCSQRGKPAVLPST